MLVSHREVGCPGTWGLELLTGSQSTPKACPALNPAASPTCHTQAPVTQSQELCGNNNKHVHCNNQ